MRQRSEEKAFEIVLSKLEQDRAELKRQEAILQHKLDGLNYAIKILGETACVVEPK